MRNILFSAAHVDKDSLEDHKTTWFIVGGHHLGEHDGGRDHPGLRSKARPGHLPHKEVKPI